MAQEEKEEEREVPISCLGAKGAVTVACPFFATRFKTFLVLTLFSLPLLLFSLAICLENVLILCHLVTSCCISSRSFLWLFILYIRIIFGFHNMCTAKDN